MDANVALDVLVDNQVLPHIGPEPATKRTYIRVNLDAPTSYPKNTVEHTPWGPEPRQDNVTPYSIRATNRTAKVRPARAACEAFLPAALRPLIPREDFPATPNATWARAAQKCWLEVLVDGARIYFAYIAEGASVTIAGINVDGKERELLFSWPRYRDAHTAAGALGGGSETDSPIGTICARLYGCVLTADNVELEWKPLDCSAFKQADKDEAKAAGVATGEGAVSTTAVGRSLGPAPASYTRRCSTYDIKPVHFAQSVLHYRERHVLVDLSLLPPLPSSVPQAGGAGASSAAAGAPRSAAERRAAAEGGSARKRARKPDDESTIIIL